MNTTQVHQMWNKEQNLVHDRYSEYHLKNQLTEVRSSADDLPGNWEAKMYVNAKTENTYSSSG